MTRDDRLEVLAFLVLSVAAGLALLALTSAVQLALGG